MQILANLAQRAHCPFCKDGLAGELWTCAGCATPHHSMCWNEHGGCVTFGCRAPRRPRADAPRGIPAWRRALLAEEVARDRAAAEQRRVLAEAVFQAAEARRAKAARIQVEGRPPRAQAFAAPSRVSTLDRIWLGSLAVFGISVLLSVVPLFMADLYGLPQESLQPLGTFLAYVAGLAQISFFVFFLVAMLRDALSKRGWI